MLESIRKAIVVPYLSIEGAAAAATVAALLWLLAHGYIQPLAVFLLELFLTF